MHQSESINGRLSVSIPRADVFLGRGRDFPDRAGIHADIAVAGVEKLAFTSGHDALELQFLNV